jgi:hypothetical protein
MKCSEGWMEAKANGEPLIQVQFGHLTSGGEAVPLGRSLFEKRNSEHNRETIWYDG